MTLNGFIHERLVDRQRVETHKQRMLAEVRAHRLRELRQKAGLTQAELARRIGVGQRRVSKIEHGDLESIRIGTLRRYLEALGRGMSIEYILGDRRVQVARWAGRTVAPSGDEGY